MLAISNILTFTALAGIGYSDFKEKQIALYWFLICAIGTVFTFFMGNDIETHLTTTGINFAFVMMQLSCLLLYIRVKYQSWDINQFFGYGDILFLVLMTLMFDTINFIILYFIGLFAAMFVGFAFKAKLTKIPLAGILSLLCLVFQIGKWIIK